MLFSEILSEFSDAIEHGFGSKFDSDNIRSKNHTVFMNQVHGNCVRIITNESKIEECDSIITQKSCCILCVRTADCIPVLIFDPVKKIAAAVHSGRAGLEKRVISHTLNVMKSEFYCTPEDIRVALGPAISGSRYQVDTETFNNFIEKTKTVQIGDTLDLKAAAFRELREGNVLVEHIDDIKVCTYNNDDFNSYRRNKTAQRQISFIALRSNG